MFIGHLAQVTSDITFNACTYIETDRVVMQRGRKAGNLGRNDENE